MHLSHWGVRPGDLKTQAGPVPYAWGHNKLQLVRQRTRTTAGARSAGFQPHFAPPTAHGARMGERHVNRHVDTDIGLSGGQAHFGRLDTVIT